MQNPEKLNELAKELGVGGHTCLRRLRTWRICRASRRAAKAREFLQVRHTCGQRVNRGGRIPSFVLIGGPAGSGKSTTLSALIQEINARDARHIVTIEDPFEYEHKHLRSVIEQVEIGTESRMR